MSPTDKKKLPPEAHDVTANAPAFQEYADALKCAQGKKNTPSQAGGTALCGQKNNVEVIEEEGVVKKIKVTCSCGEVIEIDCDYGVS